MRYDPYTTIQYNLSMMTFIYFLKQTSCYGCPSTIMTTPNLSTSGLPNSLGHPYTPASVAAVAALFWDIPKLSPEMQKTAVHAILRSKRAFENPCETTKNGCLDNMYVELHGLGKAQRMEAREIWQLENEMHVDLLDAVRPNNSVAPNYHNFFF